MSTDMPPTLKQPEGYSFSDLKLRRCDANAIDLDVVKVMCKLKGLDVEKGLTNPGPVISFILSVWYKSHLARGGATDPVMETLRQPPTLH